MPAQISVHALRAKLDAGEPVLLVDVRYEWEFHTAALQGSLLIPLPELPDRTDEVTPPEGALVVTVCHHGVRSLSAAVILEAAGITRVASLAGGLDRWSLEIDPKLPRY